LFKKNFLQKFCLSNDRSSIALFPRELSSHFNFSTFFILEFHFMLDPDPDPDPEPENIPVPAPLKQNVAVPAVPVPQHCIKGLRYF
jgi:hypothetical protein